MYVDKARINFIVSSSRYCLLLDCSLEFPDSTKRLFSCLFKIIIFFYDIVWQETMQYLDMTNFTSCPLCDTFILVFIAQRIIIIMCLLFGRQVVHPPKAKNLQANK